MPRTSDRIDIRAETGEALTLGVSASVWPVADGACYMVSCNGDHRGQDCSGRDDVRIEEGDSWQTIDAAVAFTVGHIAEHEERAA